VQNADTATISSIERNLRDNSFGQLPGGIFPDRDFFYT